MWYVSRIAEADYGCEERMPGEPLMALVTLESDDGRECRFEVPEDWLEYQKIEEGDEWPEDIDKPDEESKTAVKMASWMDNYMEALREMADVQGEENAK
ncbi:MAG: hypothetical protein ACI4FX_02055 [Agathobacter sp.]